MRSKVLFALVLLVAFPLAANVRQEMIVSTDWLAERLDGRVIVVEVGTKDDYDRGHIPGARLLQRRSLLVEVEGIPNELPSESEIEQLLTGLGIGEEKRVVFYSRQPLLATRAWFTLDYYGHGHRASVLDGGFAKWIAEGKPASAEEPAISPDRFGARRNPSAVTSFKVMKELIRSRNVLGDSLIAIDARPEPNYRGDTPGEGIYRAGHIPGAINIPWGRNLTGTNDDAVFRSADELRDLYTRYKVTRGATVVVYCRTGVEASMTYFVLRYLGLDASLYDGSFIEWSDDAGTPVV